MSSYADNDVYLSLGGTQIQAYFKSVNPSMSANGVDITRGAGQDWMQRSPGLKDISFSIDLSYDAANVQTYVQKLAAGQVISLEYGPEGAVTGKPRHVQNVHIDSVDHTVSVDKSDVVFSIKASGADTPSVNIFAGGVYS